MTFVTAQARGMLPAAFDRAHYRNFPWVSILNAPRLGRTDYVWSCERCEGGDMTVSVPPHDETHAVLEGACFASEHADCEART